MSETRKRRWTLWSVLFLPLAATTSWLALLGKHAARPISSWEFERDHSQIALETRTWLVPHSVTVVWLLVDGELYIPSRHATGKRWVGNVLRRLEVRLRIGEQIHDARLARVVGAATLVRLHSESFQKWPRFRGTERTRTMWSSTILQSQDTPEQRSGTSLLRASCRPIRPELSSAELQVRS